MNIIVLVKQVPDTSEVKINRETNTLIRDGVPSIINPFDMYAIEEALRLREKHGGKVTALTMGPPQAAQVLEPGEKVVIKEGVYRERIDPARGGTGPEKMIGYEAAPGAKVVVKGSRLVPSGWAPSAGFKIVTPAAGAKPVIFRRSLEDLDFRAMIPVNIRSDRQRESLGNQITMMVARLPLDEADPRRRLQRVSEATRELKGSRQALGVKTLEDISDWTLTTLFSAFARLSARSRPYNVVVTNVPGPQFPTYFLGAQMRSVYPLVSLNKNQALGIALFSYNDGLYWGLNADWDALPDLHDLAEAIDGDFWRRRVARVHGQFAHALAHGDGHGVPGDQEQGEEDDAADREDEELDVPHLLGDGGVELEGLDIFADCLHQPVDDHLDVVLDAFGEYRALSEPRARPRLDNGLLGRPPRGEMP